MTNAAKFRYLRAAFKMWFFVARRRALEVGASVMMRERVIAPTMAAAMARERSWASAGGKVFSWWAIKLAKRRKPFVAASRVAASERASSLPRAASTQPVDG